MAPCKSAVKCFAAQGAPVGGAGGERAGKLGVRGGLLQERFGERVHQPDVRVTGSVQKHLGAARGLVVAHVHDQADLLRGPLSHLDVPEAAAAELPAHHVPNRGAGR